MVGIADNVLIREVSLILSVLCGEVPLYSLFPSITVTRSTSTSNLYVESHCDTSLQTDAELWEMDCIVDTSSPYSVYTLPIQRLVNAAVMGDPVQQAKATGEVEEHFEKLLSLTKPLVAATLSYNNDMAKYVCV